MMDDNSTPIMIKSLILWPNVIWCTKGLLIGIVFKFFYRHCNLLMAEVMNNIPKIVFSKTLQSVEEGPRWKNIKLFHEIDLGEMIRLKEQEGKGIAILGSGTIIQQFANLGLIDECILQVNPVIFGAGKNLFADVEKMDLKLLEARKFKNGIVWLRYQPIK